jgi:hypothetical protein
LGMIMSVSTLIIRSGAATPSSVVNLSIPSPDQSGIVLFDGLGGVFVKSRGHMQESKR